MLDIVVDALIDTIKLIPFLFITYLLMEWLEHRTSEKTKMMIRNSGKFGPVFGGLLGVLPQCGFSAAAANLYAGRVITTGTLIAVFLSTSDEMLPVMISEQAEPQLIISVILSKLLIGIGAGFIIDVLGGRKHSIEKIEVAIGHVCHNDHCHCEKSIAKSAVKHTFVITFFILAITLVINVLIYFVSEETIAMLVLDRPVLGPVLAGIVGLIPNCAASVVITQLYLQKLISFGAMMSGLLVGSGVGIMILFKVNDDVKDNAMIVAKLYAIGVICGMLMDFL